MLLRAGKQVNSAPFCFVKSFVGEVPKPGVKMEEPSTPDHYFVLGVAQTATEREIKTAYRILSRKWHPDKNIREKAEAHLMMVKVMIGTTLCQ